jgi:hypothetical protein
MRRGEIAGALLCGALAACANHIRFADVEGVSEHGVVLESRAELRDPPQPIAQSPLRLELIERERVLLRSEKHVAQAEFVTPYRPARELVEVPAGLVMLPLAVVRGAVDEFVFLGRLPGHFWGVQGYGSWPAAALNPLLNTEDPERELRRDLGTHTDLLWTREKPREIALANRIVALSFDGRREWLAETDANGVLELPLLTRASALGLAQVPRRLTLLVRDAHGAEQLRESLFVQRDLAERLQRALPLARLAERPDIPPVRLARVLTALDQLGFQPESARWLQLAEARLTPHPATLATLQRTLAAFAAAPPELAALLAGLAPHPDGPDTPDTPVPAAPPEETEAPN